MASRKDRSAGGYNWKVIEEELQFIEKQLIKTKDEARIALLHAKMKKLGEGLVEMGTNNFDRHFHRAYMDIK